MDNQKICPFCGNEVDDTFSFCPACGEPLTKEARIAKQKSDSVAQLKLIAVLIDEMKDPRDIALLKKLAQRIGNNK